MRKSYDLVGKPFERLIVIERVENNKYGNSMWLCECKCGKRVRVRGDALINGNTKSCGCLRTEKIIERSTTHGKTHSPSYMVWDNMRSRCYDPKDKEFSDYGGRGIIVCDRWRESFEAFYEDVSKLPHFGEQGYTLNRINNDGNYEPNNVEWADRTAQANNKRNNHFVTFNGKTQTISQWAKECGMKYSTLERRINYCHWSVEKALTTPPKKH